MKDYEMFTAAGNMACEKLVRRIQKKILSKHRITAEEVAKAIEAGQIAIESKHPEVYDTEPRGHICHEISKTLGQVGYGFFINSYCHPCPGLYASGKD